jgi:polysaccharide biosynthesis transport protein
MLSPAGPSDAQLGPASEADLGLSPRERMNVLAVFRKNLKVKPVAGTRLIDISYLSSSPRIAAEVVNHLAQGLSDYNFETRHDATARTAHYLTGQLADLRRESEEQQARVARAQRDSGVLSLGGVDAQGREQVYSSVLDKLQQATTTYTQAQSNRIAKEAIYQVAKTGDPEAISSLSAGAMFSANGDNGLALLQSLRMQQATMQGQIAEASAKFGPAFPKLAEMRQHLDALNASIATEVARVADRAKNDAEVARGVEDNSRKVYLDLKGQADALNDKTIAYAILRQEADQSRNLYDTLFRQLKQAGVLADFRVGNISIVDPARIPAKPAKPNVPLYLAASLFGGLLFGCCGALLRDTLDNKIQNLPELEAQLGQTPLGILPYYKESARTLRSATPAARALESAASFVTSNLVARSPMRETLPQMHEEEQVEASFAAHEGYVRLAALHEPQSAYVEALRALRTSLLLSRGGAPPQVILVTSSVAAEGKSTLSSNFAILLAQQGKRVLLVDADLRRPTLHRCLNVQDVDGLSSLLTGHSQAGDPVSVATPIAEVPGLYVLPAGPVPPFPAELLSSDQMHEAIDAWRQHFDFIVIDGSPVLPVTDSVVLSSMADFTLLVARYQLTQRQSLDRGYRLLQSKTEHHKLGIVLNAVRRTSSSYYQYYGYNNATYYGSEQHV